MSILKENKIKQTWLHVKFWYDNKQIRFRLTQILPDMITNIAALGLPTFD